MCVNIRIIHTYFIENKHKIFIFQMTDGRLMVHFQRSFFHCIPKLDAKTIQRIEYWALKTSVSSTSKNYNSRTHGSVACVRFGKALLQMEFVSVINILYRSVYFYVWKIGFAYLHREYVNFQHRNGFPISFCFVRILVFLFRIYCHSVCAKMDFHYQLKIVHIHLTSAGDHAHTSQYSIR